MTNMAHLAKEENALIIKLTEKASRDADILKTLTILALFFLPASFVAVRIISKVYYVHAKPRKELAIKPSVLTVI